jgi:hypothetical protein
MLGGGSLPRSGMRTRRNRARLAAPAAALGWGLQAYQAARKGHRWEGWPFNVLMTPATWQRVALSLFRMFATRSGTSRVHASPVSATWHPGDGSTVTCQGAGTPYTSADNPASPNCGHTYTSSSAAQPDGAFHTTAVAAFQVAESRALKPAADLTAAGCQRGLPGKGRNRACAQDQDPGLQASAGRGKRRLADHRRTVAGTGGKAARGTPEVHERSKKGTSRVYRSPVTMGESCPSGT